MRGRHGGDYGEFHRFPDRERGEWSIRIEDVREVEGEDDGSATDAEESSS
jgi:hypothetical protein